MTNSKTTYKLHNGLPAYTVAQWFETYQGFIKTIFSTPKKNQKGSMWVDFMELVNKVKLFLKEQNVKFI
jgi:hypothetical protein